MTNKNDCSLADTKKLRDLIIENPTLPLLIFASEESWSGEFDTEQAGVSSCCIEELTTYNDRWLDKDDFMGKLEDDCCDLEEYKNLSDEDFYKKLDEIIAEKEFVKAIVVYV